MQEKDDLLVAEARDDEAAVQEPVRNVWQVLIVDDEEAVHHVTKLALKRLMVDGRAVEFLSAYSAEEAKVILQRRQDIAVVLLDVVMEDESAGLRLVRYIREDLGNKLTRLIIRTGQPGQAPEYDVLCQYDINDYKEKIELTAQKLYTTVITALRSYRDLQMLDARRKSMQKVIVGVAAVFQLQCLRNFAREVLCQLQSLLGGAAGQSGVVVSMGAEQEDIISTLGAYKAFESKSLIAFQLENAKACRVIEEAVKGRRNLLFPGGFVLYFSSRHGAPMVVYMDGFLAFKDWEINLLQVFSDNVAIALENIYLNQEVENAQKEIIFTLGEIAETRSREMGSHVKRVAEIGKLLALKYGLSSEEAELLRLAAPIHDVGKLAIPDAILNKPGKLSAEEFEIMKQHAGIGYEMLKNSKHNLIMTGALIALHHHERYDGTGYPQGLKGEGIPIYGRIVALADVFDALSSKRIYKEGWPLEKVLEYIKQQRGSQFDPTLVDILMENLAEIVAIKEKYRDA